MNTDTYYIYLFSYKKSSRRHIVFFSKTCIKNITYICQIQFNILQYCLEIELLQTTTKYLVINRSFLVGAP